MEQAREAYPAAGILHTSHQVSRFAGAVRADA